ncbi:hypothetical protein DFH08DRAFT_204451 [Mycena albidolilacea]|uniref:Uncharacterized protein n=1 Tax=Mycena albidolilacea TaxID=1033008 RepID=A0AAD7EQ60_9AGAR|nr:hypothetical protein DFH08DRAFT_204451 [Mycena albidolilacea]
MSNPPLDTRLRCWFLILYKIKIHSSNDPCPVPFFTSLLFSTLLACQALSLFPLFVFPVLFCPAVMFSSTFSRLAIFLGLCSCVVAAPLNALQARTEEKCADNRLAPCTCHGALGLRLDSTHLSSNCPAQSFKFTNPASGKDGTVALVPDNLGEVQCDHIVELQFIANQIQKVPGICRHFQSTTGTADFQTFFNTINSQPNLVFVQSTVNHAKGIVFSNRNFKGTTEKAAAGVVSYLGLLQSNGDATRAADTIDAAMTRIMGAGNGFQTFQAHFTAAVDAAKKTTQRQVASGILSPAPVPGDPFVHQTESTNVRCGGSKTS